MGVQPKKNSRLFILLGVALTLLSMVGVYFIAQSSSQSAAGTEQVLVATRQIPIHTVFGTTNDVTVWMAPLTVPTSAVPVGAFTSSAAFAKSELSGGRISSAETIYPKEVVLPSMFLGLGKSRTTFTSAFDIPKNDVAISLNATQLDESGGAIQPGDSVDIMASFLPGGGGSGAADQAPSGNRPPPSQTQFVLQNIKVVALGTWTGNGDTATAPAGGSTMLTFVVNRNTSLIIQHLKDFSGSWAVSVVLRSAYSNQQYNTSPIDGTYFFAHLRNNFEK